MKYFIDELTEDDLLDDATLHQWLVRWLGSRSGIDHRTLRNGFAAAEAALQARHGDPAILFRERISRAGREGWWLPDWAIEAAEARLSAMRARARFFCKAARGELDQYGFAGFERSLMAAPITEEILADQAQLMSWIEIRLAQGGLSPSPFQMVRGMAAALRVINNNAPADVLESLFRRGLHDGWEAVLTEHELKLAGECLDEFASQHQST